MDDDRQRPLICGMLTRMKWTNLDQAYLEIFGTHPDVSAVGSTVTSMSSGASLEPSVDATHVLEQELSEMEREILEFERSWWKHAGAKETAVRDKFDMSSTRYYQVLNAVIEKPAALRHDPMLVRRLTRLRDTRRAQRSATRSAPLNDD